jgi:hypothetical protein
MKIVNTVDLGNGIIEAEFDTGQKAQYRKEDMADEPTNPEHFQSEVRKMAQDSAETPDKGGKKRESKREG